jgi:hypothetical protein
MMPQLMEALALEVGQKRTVDPTSTLYFFHFVR